MINKLKDLYINRKHGPISQILLIAHPTFLESEIIKVKAVLKDKYDIPIDYMIADLIWDNGIERHLFEDGDRGFLIVAIHEDGYEQVARMESRGMAA